MRFGNVLGSRGSVLTTFAAQIDAGGPITVTHPDVTRYFMTVRGGGPARDPGGAIGRDGEVLVLDMGEPVRILDVARSSSSRTRRTRSTIVFTGLQARREAARGLVWAPARVDRRPIHPLISHVPVPSVTHGDVLSLPDPRRQRASRRAPCGT